MHRSLPAKRWLGLALATTTVFVAVLGDAGTVAAQNRSPIVLNCDGGGTTIVKPFADFAPSPRPGMAPS